MMVANVTMQTNTESMIYGDLDSIMQLKNGNFLLSQAYFKELNENAFQINEFRFFCHRPSHGRTIHIASTTSSDSREWVQYLLGNHDIHGLNCFRNCHDVFRRLEGDNSLLAQSQNEIRYGRPVLQPPQRVYDHQVFFPGEHHFIVTDLQSVRRFECDDMNGNAHNPAVWQVYIR